MLQFDVAVLAGPRVDVWPSVGVRALSLFCTQMGLSVGQFGGESMTVRGLIPLPGIGGIAVIEDAQNRIHRVQSRAVIRVTPESFLPPPFLGWYSPGLIPISTAEKLMQSELIWEPTTAILGTGNRALRFGAALLRRGVNQVYCIESSANWGNKRFAGWEVERRQFEMLGGKIIEASPIEIVFQGPLRWMLRLKDTQGVRMLEVARVVSAGPFEASSGIREYPVSSCLFELEQSAPSQFIEDVEGWALEEERGLLLAGKLVRALIQDLGPQREEWSRVFKKAKTRLSRYRQHLEKPYIPSYDGKWLSSSEGRKLKAFSGVPKHAQMLRSIASVECFEDIACRVCEDVCPTQAITLGRSTGGMQDILQENKCISCGICVKSCPSSSISLVHEVENRAVSTLTLPHRGQPWKQGQSAILVNRRGESLGAGRVLTVDGGDSGMQLVQVEVPAHLTWDARGLRRAKVSASLDAAYLSAVERSATRTEKVEVLMNGEKRWVRDNVSIALALFETGQNRPEDLMLCPDGSCGLCVVTVDSVTKLACQTKIHQGMSIRTVSPSVGGSGDTRKSSLCPCMEVATQQVVDRLRSGELHSPEAVLAVSHVGEGVCHGQICKPALLRVLASEGLPSDQWIDWRFPWVDWTVKSSEHHARIDRSSY